MKKNHNFYKKNMYLEIKWKVYKVVLSDFYDKKTIETQKKDQKQS